jgi:hypothetical protein
VDDLLGVIEARVSRGQTGARWQREMLERLLVGETSRDDALSRMLNRYLSASEGGKAVHEWDVDPG